MVDTFDFPFELTAGGEDSPRLLSAKFGDSYAQEVPDGINPIESTWSITVTGALETVKAARDFLRGHVGLWFWWFPPLEDAQVMVKVSGGWRFSRTSASTYSLQVTFKRVYVGG